MKSICAKTILVYRIKCIVISALAVASAVFALIGCSSDASVAFAVDELSLSVGETRDILPYIELDVSIDRGDIVLTADGDCIEIDGTNIKAVSAGTCFLTASCKNAASSTLKVTALYRDVRNITVEYSGDLIQNLGNGESPSQIIFSASLGEDHDPETTVDWYTDGEKRASGMSYTFLPSGFGRFEIKAQCGNAFSLTYVNVYRETSAYSEVRGELYQDQNFTPITFVAVEQADTRNPPSLYEWRVNGITSSDLPVFEFVPTAAGEYEISLSVNGVARETLGGGNATVIAVGDRKPLGEVVFDDRDGVFVEWSDGAAVRSVTVIDPNGVKSNIESADIRNSYRFKNGIFDATGLIEICAEEPKEYSVRLNTDIQGDFFIFKQYPSAASEYIDKTVFIFNAFLSDAAQAEALVYDMYALGDTSVKAYIAQGLSEDDVTAAVKKGCANVGISARTTISDNVLSVVSDAYSNRPTSLAVSSAELIYSELPHTAGQDDAVRSSQYVLSIDRSKRQIDVSGSEQLLSAVLNGIRPMPVSGSDAEVVYRRARAVLLAIIGKDFTQEQKTHAVFDWLIWNTRCAEADGSSARFLEGVFGGAGVTANGVVSSLGVSKAFALLCGMEGIDCVLQSCEYDNIGGGIYYWNKVNLDGAWYNVDVYGSKSGSQDIGLTARNVELGSHSRLLISDDRAELLGLAPDRELLSPYDGKMYYLQKYSYNGEYFDYFIDRSEYNNYAVVKTPVYYALENGSVGYFTFYGINGTVTISKVAYGMQFYLDGEPDADELAKIKTNIAAAVKEYCEIANVTAENAIVTFYPLYSEYDVPSVLHVNVLLPTT